MQWSWLVVNDSNLVKWLFSYSQNMYASNIHLIYPLTVIFWHQSNFYSGETILNFVIFFLSAHKIRSCSARAEITSRHPHTMMPILCFLCVVVKRLVETGPWHELSFLDTSWLLYSTSLVYLLWLLFIDSCIGGVILPHPPFNTPQYLVLFPLSHFSLF